VAVSDYQTKVNAAKQKCETAFDVAAEKYRKKEKDLAATRAVLAEKENFFRGLTDTRTLWAGGRKKFILTDKGEWQETNEQGQTFRYKETDRTKDYVEMRDAVRGYSVRLMDTRALVRTAEVGWHLLDDGGWEQAKKK